MCYLRLCLVSAVLGLAASALADPILRVDWESTAQNPDGSTWALAYPYLQDALDALRKGEGTHTGADDSSVLVDSTQSWAEDELVGLTVVNYTDDSSGTVTSNNATMVTATLSGGTENDWDNGDEYEIVDSSAQIWVRLGTYHPDDGANVQSGDQTASFRLVRGVEMYGGFDGDEVTFDERPEVKAGFPATLTTLSGDIDEDSTLDTDNSHHVVTGTRACSSTILDGFNITMGWARDASYWGGGGLIIGDNLVCTPHPSYGDPVISNCRFEENTAINAGAVSVLQGNATFMSCFFTDNEATGWAGAVNTSGGSCAISGNNGPQYGDSTFVDCIFVDNKTTGITDEDGGGALTAGNSAPTVVSCSFFDNEAGEGQEASLAVGGAIWITSNPDAPGASNGTLVANCVFSGNQSYYDGGAIQSDCYDTGATCAVTVANSSFYSNDAKGGTNNGRGGGIRVGDGDITIKNSIFWNNDDQHSGTSHEQEQISLGAGTATVAYDCIDTGGSGLSDYSGNNNIDDNPQFVDADGSDNQVGTTDDDLRLSSENDSPCIDTGDNDALPADSLDLDEDSNTAEALPLDRELLPRRIDDLDSTDVSGETSPVVDMGAYEFHRDCNTNGVPDTCDLDCVTDGLCDGVDCTEGSLDCNTNDIPDECDLRDCTGQAFCEDVNSNEIPDVCEDIVTAVSCLTHGEEGEFCVDLMEEEGQTLLNVEPRADGVLKVVFELDWNPPGTMEATVDCDATYGGTVSTDVEPNGNEVTVTFSTALPDEDACTIELDAVNSFCVRTAAGDIDRGGTVTTSDASIIKPHYGEELGEANFIFDYDVNGVIATSDFSQVKPNFGNEAGTCP